MARKVKLTGERSIQSKLHRLAYELEHDASRIAGDYGDACKNLANAVRSISSKCGDVARGMSDD